MMNHWREPSSPNLRLAGPKSAFLGTRSISWRMVKRKMEKRLRLEAAVVEESRRDSVKERRLEMTEVMPE